jgi:HSP20 family molecular chaperone IbpA
MHVEEFTEEGVLVILVEINGSDSEENVDVSVTSDTLHVNTERCGEEKSEGRDYARREFHYGAFRSFQTNKLGWEGWRWALSGR